jgi:hypothetical protein
VNEDAMTRAFDAIHYEAAKLLALVPNEERELRGGLELILSLARYKSDIRSPDEIKKARGE